ncbi:hypothetical protein NMY22_g13827 [Coprinellus aureogranulatus]|nr:hypothetical protein NMY22_g13827 [Coprinellus aureogranulatus]
MDAETTDTSSPDLLIQVLCYLDAIDIIAVRSTCRKFYRASLSKTVWMAALDRACDEHGIYKPSFPMEKMSTTELEHAVAAPRRFVKAVEDLPWAHPRELPPYQKVLGQLTAPLNANGEPEERFYAGSAFLVPGGRFLVTFGSHVCLWDLGYNATSQSPGTPPLIAAVKLESPALQYDFGVVPSTCGKDLQVLVHTRIGTIYVYRIDPQSVNPEFLLEGELRLGEGWTHSGPVQRIYLDSTFAVFSTETNLYVWNWSQKTGCTWLIEIDDTVYYSGGQIYVCERAIITLNADYDFSVWEIPQLYPVPDSIEMWPSVVNRPKTVYRRQRRDPNRPEQRLIAASMWQKESPQYIGVGVDERRSSFNSPNAFFYSVQDTTMNDEDFFPVPISGHLLRGSNSLSRRMGNEDMGRAIQLVLLRWGSRNGVLGRRGPGRGQRTRRTIGRIRGDSTPIFGFPGRKIAFCPLSGRLVYCVTDAEGPSCFVYDFISPLAQRRAKQLGIARASPDNSNNPFSFTTQGPSPLHLGGLRMALYNHLFAKKHGGKWILRIEDTDATRYVPGSVEGIRKSLEWAGLEYDHGPGKEGPQGPYYQSERLDLYRDYAKKLLESGHAYRCFCSMDRLQDVRERLARTGSNATYDRECLHLTEEEVARRVKAGEKSIVRLNGTHLPSRPTGVDLVFGQLKDAHASLATDPVLLKTDLFPTYHLASVVDDHEMGITHVLRGEEWLPSLPLHLDLYAALKLTPPQFAHLPILLNPDGSKMSKRKGDVRVEDYIVSPGFTLWSAPQTHSLVLVIEKGLGTCLRFELACTRRWGAKHDPFAETSSSSESESDSATSKKSSSHSHTHDAPDSTAVYTLQELIREFDLTAVTHRNTSLDPMKLEYLNKQHLLRERSTPEGLTAMAQRIHDVVKDAFPESPYTSVEMIKKAITLLEGRLTNAKELPIHAYYLFEEPNMEAEEATEMQAALEPQTQGWFHPFRSFFPCSPVL